MKRTKHQHLQRVELTRKRITKETNMKQRKATLFITNLAADLKCQFKAYCARRGKTMTEMITEMMKEKILEDWKKGKKK